METKMDPAFKRLVMLGLLAALMLPALAVLMLSMLGLGFIAYRRFA